MHSPVVLCIFATAVLVLVQCALCYSEKHDVHNPEIIRNCFKSKVKRNMINTKMNARAELHDMLVPVNPTDDEYEFEPSVVMVKRCGGHCPYPMSPMPMETKNATLIVKLRKKGNYENEKCVELQVEEHHTDCRCRCDHPEQSGPNQIWDEGNCAYVCNNESEKSVCSNTYAMEWNEEECRCQCTKRLMNCPNDYTWDSTKCNCMPVKPEPPKSKHKKFGFDRAAPKFERREQGDYRSAKPYYFNMIAEHTYD